MRLFLPRLFNISREAHIDKRAFTSILCIVALSTMGYLISNTIPDIRLGNRVLHFIGGGITSTLICFFAVRESMPQLKTLRFFFISCVAIVGLGITNEMVEFGLQYLTGVIYATDDKDTWWDHASNIAGMFFSFPVFLYYLNKKQ